MFLCFFLIGKVSKYMFFKTIYYLSRLYLLPCLGVVGESFSYGAFRAMSHSLSTHNQDRPLIDRCI